MPRRNNDGKRAIYENCFAVEKPSKIHILSRVVHRVRMFQGMHEGKVFIVNMRESTASGSGVVQGEKVGDQKAE